MLADRLFSPNTFRFGQHRNWTNYSITNLETDTRRSRPGTLVLPPIDFFLPSRYTTYQKPALPQYLKKLWEGLKPDERNDILSAINQSVAGLPEGSICTAPAFLFGLLEEGDASLVYLDDYLNAVYFACRKFYGPLDDEMYIAGVTGTNGKTSTVHWLSRYLARSPKLQIATLGTLGFRLDVNGPAAEPTGFTSPPLPIVFDRLARLAEAARKSGRHPVLITELSSHGAVLGRFTGLALDGVVVASLGSDHLDFHGTQAGYLDAKWEVIEHLKRSSKKNRRLLYGSDFADEFSRQLAGLPADIERSLVVTSESAPATGDCYRVQITQASIAQATLTVPVQPPNRDKRTVKLRPGIRFQVENFAKAAVFGGLELSTEPLRDYASGQFDWPDALETAPVPGRFEVITIKQTGGGAFVVVDFAHTADALETLLSQIRPEAKGRLICLFGCGGDRDKSKRPAMGRAAASLSEHIIITSDNPRTEDPQSIIDDILPGVQGRSFEVIIDRQKAIHSAVGSLEPKDILVVAGKGHEDYQIVGKEKRPFSDQQEVKKAVQDTGWQIEA